MIRYLPNINKDKLEHFFWFSIGVYTLQLVGVGVLLVTIIAVSLALFKEVRDYGLFHRGVRQGSPDVLDFVFGVLPLIPFYI